MRIRSALTAVALLAASLASAQHGRRIDADRPGGYCTVPDPKLTPGEMDEAQACVSNVERA